MKEDASQHVVKGEVDVSKEDNGPGVFDF